MEQAWSDYNFEKKAGKGNKIPVESNHEEKVESKQITDRLDLKSDFNHGPKMLQCSGGNGNNSPSKNEPTMRQTKQCNSATDYPSDRCKNNDGGFGGDGNDPSRKTPKLFKGHYQAFALPLKNKSMLCTFLFEYFK